MNILVVAHYHYQGISVPTALFVHNQMREFVKNGHRVRILVPTPLGKVGQDGKRLGSVIYRETVDEIEHVFLRYPSFSNFGEKYLNPLSAGLLMRSQIRKVLEDFKPDVIHAHKLGTNTELGALLKEITGCPLVITSHGETGCEAFWQDNPGWLRKRAEQADHVVCVSSNIRRCMESAGVKVPMDVILNGFSVEKIQDYTEKIPGTVLQAGHLTKQKRVNVTIDAFRLLKSRHPETALAILGQGEERAALEQQCADYGLTDSVRFTGQVSNGQTLEEMGRSQFFVMPSVNEGFGIVYLEAMASGCVTIGTRGEGIADLIRDGENGFLVSPDDPGAIVTVMEYCMEHPRQMEKIVREGKRDARCLTWEYNATQYENLFYQLMKKE